MSILITEKSSCNNNKSRGPVADKLVIEGVIDWKDAVKKAFNKKKPKEGWPKLDKKKLKKQDKAD